MLRKIHILMVLVRLSAPLCKSEDFQENKFYGFAASVTWHEAQAKCRSRNADLITVSEARDMTVDLQNFKGWIGLHDPHSTNSWEWIRDGSRTFPDYWVAETSDEESPGQCVYKGAKTRLWKSAPCSEVHPYVCSVNTMILVTEEKTWEEAMVHCRSLRVVNESRPATMRNNYLYDLASLLSTDNLHYAKRSVQRATTDEVWTGLNFLSGCWMWMNGLRVQKPNLPSCPAAERCGTLSRDGTQVYNARSCMEKRNFICNRKW